MAVHNGSEVSHLRCAALKPLGANTSGGSQQMWLQAHAKANLHHWCRYSTWDPLFDQGGDEVDVTDEYRYSYFKPTLVVSSIPK